MKYSIAKHLVTGELHEFIKATEIEGSPMEINLVVNTKFFERIYNYILQNCPAQLYAGDVLELKFTFHGFKFTIKEYRKICRFEFKERIKLAI
jgi:hypothetical protein